MQTWDLLPPASTSATAALATRGEGQSLLPSQRQSGKSAIGARPSTLRIARQAYEVEGMGVFFRGLGICSARAFFVNAVQWAVSTRHSPLLRLRALTQGNHYTQVYEWTMKILSSH